MRHIIGWSGQILKIAGKVFVPLCLATVGVMHAESETKTSQGTVNIGLANANGIVLLTDSLQSYQDAGGWHHVQPVQKLFKLDDKTVCSIAGFASEKGWARQELDTDVAGIVADFKDQLIQHPVPQLDAKLHAIGYLVGFYIDLVANRREILSGPGTPDQAYRFEAIVAGFDSDGAPKLEKLVLKPVTTRAEDGNWYWSHTTEFEEAKLGRGLARILGGIQEVSLQVLNSPEKFGDNAAIRRYAQSRKKDAGGSLTLNEMAALASEMAAQTARQTPFVGGPDQIAILTKGTIISLVQPHLPDPPRPMKFSLMVGLRVEGALNLFTPPGVHFLWIRTQFVGIRNPRLRLDDQFFYACEIRDSIVEYGGA